MPRASSLRASADPRRGSEPLGQRVRLTRPIKLNLGALRALRAVQPARAFLSVHARPWCFSSRAQGRGGPSEREGGEHSVARLALDRAVDGRARDAERLGETRNGQASADAPAADRVFEQARQESALRNIAELPETSRSWDAFPTAREFHANGGDSRIASRGSGPLLGVRVQRLRRGCAAPWAAATADAGAIHLGAS